MRAAVGFYGGAPSVRSLPDECLLHVFRFVDVPTLHASVGLVCRRWRDIVSDGLLWHALFARHGLPLPREPAPLRHVFMQLYWEEQVWQSQRFCVNRVDTLAPSCLSLCVTEDAVLVGSEDGSVSLLDRETYTPHRSIFAHSGPLTALLALPGGDTLSAGFDGRLYVWQGRFDKLLLQIDASFANMITAVALDGSDIIVTGHLEGLLCFWDRHTGSLLAARTVGFSVLSVAVSGNWLVCAGEHGRVVLFRRSVTPFDGTFDRVSRTNSTGAINGKDGLDRRYTQDDADMPDLSPPQPGAPLSVAVLQPALDGSPLQLALGAPAPFVPHGLLHGHTDKVMSAALSEDGMLLTASYDSTVRVWDVGSLACTAVLRGHKSEVYGAQFVGDCLGCPTSPAAQRPVRVVSWGEDAQLLLWDLRMPERPIGPLANCRPTRFALDCAAISSGVIAAGSCKGELVVYDLHAQRSAGMMCL